METYVRDYANPQIEDVKLEILQYCREARSKEEILNLIRVEIKPYHVRKYITRLVEERYLQFTVSNNPRSNGQKYIITTKGTTYLKALT